MAGYLRCVGNATEEDLTWLTSHFERDGGFKIGWIDGKREMEWNGVGPIKILALGQGRKFWRICENVEE